MTNIYKRTKNIGSINKFYFIKKKFFCPFSVEVCLRVKKKYGSLYFQTGSLICRNSKNCASILKWTKFSTVENLQNVISQFVHHVGLIDLISSLIKFRLFSCRMSGRTKWISGVQKEIICNFTGKKKRIKNSFGSKDTNLDHVYRKCKT